VLTSFVTSRMGRAARSTMLSRNCAFMSAELVKYHTFFLWDPSNVFEVLVGTFCYKNYVYLGFFLVISRLRKKVLRTVWYKSFIYTGLDGVVTSCQSGGRYSRKWKKSTFSRLGDLRWPKDNKVWPKGCWCIHKHHWHEELEECHWHGPAFSSHHRAIV
jgi:hypothetical protein